MNGRGGKFGRVVALGVLAVSCASGAAHAGPDRSWLERAVALYNEKSYEGAAMVLEEAIAAGQETPSVVYNLACARAAIEK